MTLSVTLTAHDGVGSGLLLGHPAAIEVRTRKAAGGPRVGTRLIVLLFDGAHQVGSGMLAADSGWFRGQVSEFAGTWYVEGRCGSGVLTFSERPPS
jgi:hypothetical protein